MRRFRTYHEVESQGAGQVPDQVEDQLRRLTERLREVRAVWLIASGKGGVGKSAITANLAVGLARRGLRVGALDADLNGPSLARMLGADRNGLLVDDEGVRPAEGVAGVRVISTDLLLDTDDAPLRWREPDSFGFVWQSTLETGALREFVADVRWGSLDVLLLDLPPGTDKLMRTFQLIPRPTGVILVTTPSEAARSVVRRSVRLVQERNDGFMGLVANMTTHECPSCGHTAPLFQSDGARELATDSGAELWAEIPFDPRVASETDAGRPPVLDRDPAPAARALQELADRVAEMSGAATVAAPAPTPGGEGDTS